MSLEQRSSISIPSQAVPILVSSLVLRERLCGQIDLCFILKDVIYLIELKTKPLVINNNQRRRLHNSGTLLGAIFNKAVIIRVLKGLPNEQSFLKLLV